MKIEIRVDPKLADVELISRLVDELTITPPGQKAQAIRRDIKARLLRLKRVALD